VLFPRDGITKAQLARYYERIAPYILPHLRDRPISLERHPDGIDGFSFIQKDVSGHFPAWIRTEVVEKEGGTLRQVIADRVETLAYLANQGCITPHVWLSRADRPRRPDRLVFDFDPPRAGNADVRHVTREAASLLVELGLVPFAMTSGSRGFHLHVPLDRSLDFDDVRTFARDVARLLRGRRPDLLTVESRKDKRRGRIFIDVLRNGYAQTSVAPYAVRARDGAPVATPVDLSELTRSELHPQRYTLRNIFRRLARKVDPWEAFDADARGLAEARTELARLLERNGLSEREAA
jgi:bifunctional non-homologous end joining protein LigD